MSNNITVDIKIFAIISKLKEMKNSCCGTTCEKSCYDEIIKELEKVKIIFDK